MIFNRMISVNNVLCALKRVSKREKATISRTVLAIVDHDTAEELVVIMRMIIKNETSRGTIFLFTLPHQLGTMILPNPT